jgi:hypothetical protein
MCVVPSTILAGWRMAIASSQLSEAWRIAAIDRLTNLRKPRLKFYPQYLKGFILHSFKQK